MGWGLVLFLFSNISNAGVSVPGDDLDLGSGPESALIEDHHEQELTSAFCAEWNPDYAFKGSLCCGKVSWHYRRRGISCSPKRSKRSFCDEMTDMQRRYVDAHGKNELGDILKLLSGQIEKTAGTQAHCSPNNGFLAWGRPILPTGQNRLRLRRPNRCVNFGTDGMVGMLEWVGRRIHARFLEPAYDGVRLLVGDISAPRGGCLKGHGGRRGHSSHMSGMDVDLGFFNVKKNRSSPREYTRYFHPEENWWLLKQVFKNPYACVEKVFLDHRLIRKLRRVAMDDPDWPKVQPYIRHVRRHRNHFHIRVGERPGPPGCEFEENLVPELAKQ